MLFGYVGDVYDESHAISVRDDTTTGKVQVRLMEVDGHRISAEFDREVFWKYVKPVEALDG